MVPFLTKTASRIDRLSESFGRFFAWFALILVVLMAINVLERYLFHTGTNWQQELVMFFHAMLFLGASSYTWLHDKHVRIDVVYHRLSPKGKAVVDLTGTLLFMVPVCVCIFFFSYDFVVKSWMLLEKSSEYNGMPGIFLLKTFIWFFAGSLLLQSVSTCCRAILTLKGDA